MSGAPLRARSTDIIRILYRITGKDVPIIGVGGIASGQDAYDKLRAGASLVQLYTSFIYEGPAVARKVKAELLELLRREGLGMSGSDRGRGVIVFVPGL